MAEKQSKRIVGMIVFSLVVVFLVHECATRDKSSQDATPASSQAAAVKQSDNKPPPMAEFPIANIPWETVNAIYNLNSRETDFSKDEKWKQFAGKRVRWTGTVTEVSETLGSLTMQVKMNQETLTSDLIVNLEDSQRASALLLKQGDSVNFSGVLDRWGSILPITLRSGVIETSHHVAPANSHATSSDDSTTVQDRTTAAYLAPSSDLLLESARKAAESVALQQLGQLAPVSIISSVARWQTKDDRMDELENLETAAWSQADVIVTVQVRFAGLRRNLIVGCKTTQKPGSWATSTLQTDIQ